MARGRAWALAAAVVTVPAAAAAAVALLPVSRAALGPVDQLTRGDVTRPPSVGRGSTRTSPAGVATSGVTARPTAVVRVSTRDGRLSFVAPPGWLYGPCPQPSDSCVEIAPARIGGSDAIDVLVAAAAAGDSASGAGTEAELAGSAASGSAGGRLIVDGRPAMRIDLASNGSVLVYGSMPAGGERFMVACRYDTLQRQIRQGCDHVAASLTIAVG